MGLSCTVSEIWRLIGSKLFIISYPSLIRLRRCLWNFAAKKSTVRLSLTTASEWANYQLRRIYFYCRGIDNGQNCRRLYFEKPCLWDTKYGNRPNFEWLFHRAYSIRTVQHKNSANVSIGVLLLQIIGKVIAV